MPVFLSPVDDQLDGGMAGLGVTDVTWTVSLQDKPKLKAHKPLRKRRDYVDNLEHVTTLPLDTTDAVNGHGVLPETGFFNQQSPQISSPTLPLTPPSGSGDDTPQQATSELDMSLPNNAQLQKGGAVTPRAQRTPPTPDNTPPRVNVALLERHDTARSGEHELSRLRRNPRRAISSSSTQSFWTPEERIKQQVRPFLGTQPSISSRAESFKTAREEFSSDDDSTTGWFSPRFPFQQTSPILQSTSPDLQSLNDPGDPLKRSKLRHEMSNDSTVLASRADEVFSGDSSKTPDVLSIGSSTVGQPSRTSALNTALAENTRLSTPTATKRSPTSPLESPASSQRCKIETAKAKVRHFENDNVTQRTRDFSNAIGRIPLDDSMGLNQRVNSWRHSGLSSTSTVEAIVVETTSPRLQKLRHTRKHTSLRSASSPIPRSNRTSWNSGASTEVHRLVRKPATLTNENRLSIASESQRVVRDDLKAIVPTLNQPADAPKVEMIPVVVIPQRKSSLKSSTSSSRRHSVSTAPGSGARRSEDSASTSQTNFRLGVRPRAMSDSSSGRLNPSIRGRDRTYPPTVPPRTSSLSAPTSRNGSRASSMTSETLRQRRLAAEEDVRRTLARMESDSERSPVTVQSHPTSKEMEQMASQHEVPSSSGHLQPPPAPFTPFSQRSILTSSTPGEIEIYEATAVNYFSHNNDSLQLIEGVRFNQQEPRQAGDVAAERFSTPPRLIPNIVMDSPLKNPREPPQPPAFKVIPPTPAVLTPKDEFDRQLAPTSDRTNSLSRTLGSVKRAFSVKRHSDLFRPAFPRTLGTSQAYNRRQKEDLDNKLHPFWRPRSFWDDYSESETESEPNDEDIIVNNSLGMPQSRIIFDGPLSLVRRLSDRRAHYDKQVIKRASLNSLTQESSFRNTHIVHLITDIRSRLHGLRMKPVQDRLTALRQRLEEQKREKRREELRESIGPTVVARGDSRYPVSSTMAAEDAMTSWPRNAPPVAA